MDSKFFNTMRDCYKWNQEIYNALTPDAKTKYLYNYLQWKQIEATELGKNDEAQKFYELKQEIQLYSDPISIKKMFKIKKLTDDLYNKLIDSKIKKLNIELDFLED